VRWYLGLLNGPPDDRQQALVQKYGSLEFPCTTLGCDGVGRDHKHDGIGRFDQGTKPIPPVFGGDVVLVGVSLKASQHKATSELLGKVLVLARVGNIYFELRRLCYPRVGHFLYQESPRNGLDHSGQQPSRARFALTVTKIHPASAIPSPREAITRRRPSPPLPLIHNLLLNIARNRASGHVVQVRLALPKRRSMAIVGPQIFRDAAFQ
jgi:hypothetical protein